MRDGAMPARIGWWYLRNHHRLRVIVRTSLALRALRKEAEEKHLRMMRTVYTRRRHAAFQKWRCRTIRKTCAPGGVGEKRDRAAYEADV